MAVGYEIYLHNNTDQPERHKYKMKSIRKICSCLNAYGYQHVNILVDICLYIVAYMYIDVYILTCIYAYVYICAHITVLWRVIQSNDRMHKLMHTYSSMQQDIQTNKQYKLKFLYLYMQ
jgi:uncharacterized membrane protein YqjE